MTANWSEIVERMVIAGNSNDEIIDAFDFERGAVSEPIGRENGHSFINEFRRFAFIMGMIEKE